MTAQQLKNSILQMAVQGKLVPQDPNDEPASVLLERIKKEKQELIKAGKIKKDSKSSEIFRGASRNFPYTFCEQIGKEVRDISDEIPFDIPESWEWCRLGDILLKLTDGTHSTPKYTESGIPFISVKDVSSGRLDFSKCKHISEKEHSELYERCNPEYGDILLTKVGTTGIPVVVDTNEQFSLFVSVALLKFNQKLLYNKYLICMINSPLVQIQATENTKGVGNKNWVMRDISNTLIVIPPLAEQHRIVSKIEELLPYIDKYEQAETQLTTLNTTFPEALKKSILQEAVQGKLVPQDPNDEPASVLLERIRTEKKKLVKEGKIKKDKSESVIVTRDKIPYEIIDGKERCIADEVPFEIPESWCWCRLGSIIQIESGKGLTSKQMINGDIPVYGGNGITGYHNESLVHKETIVIGRVGYYCGSVHITEKEAWITDNAFITTYPENNIYREYLVYTLRYMNLGQNNNATAQPVVSGKKIYPMLFPLPPLAEQHRIVSKIEELMKYCEML